MSSIIPGSSDEWVPSAGANGHQSDLVPNWHPPRFFLPSRVILFGQKMIRTKQMTRKVIGWTVGPKEVPVKEMVTGQVCSKRRKLRRGEG